MRSLRRGVAHRPVHPFYECLTLGRRRQSAARIQPIVSIAGITSTAGAGYLATSTLSGFHVQIEGVRIGTYDTIFSLAGVLVLAGGAFAVTSLRPPVRSQPQA
jgi:hypothetical protein